MTHVLSANRLTDGAVVYLPADRTWSHHIAHARVLEEGDLDEAEAIGRAAESRNIVVAPTPVEVKGPSPTPVRLRERIRSAGPTVGDHQYRPSASPEH